MDVKLPPEWLALLAGEFEKPYFRALTDFVRAEYTAAAEQKGPPIYPAARNIFRALDRCLPSDVRVVIIGQDPYHGPGQATGLAFSVPDGVPLPPSLRNIFRECGTGESGNLDRWAGGTGGGETAASPSSPQASRVSGCLDRWADQGVLLLNASLTVREGQPGSHADCGWQTFTDAIVAALSRREGLVYMLWGAFAQRKGAALSSSKGAAIDPARNLVLHAPHPSPLSAHRGFLGCGHFAKANEYLGKEAIEW